MPNQEGGIPRRQSELEIERRESAGLMHLVRNMTWTILEGLT